MNSTPSVGDIQAWNKRFQKYQSLEAAAMRRRDIPAANRHVEKVTVALDALANSGAEGKAVLEELMRNADPSIRGRAARRVIGWDPDRAAPVLARLLHEPLDPQSASAEAVSIRIEAEHALLQHFGLDIFDPRKLPDRLAAMGIKLPEKTARKLKWER